jgi:iron(III) transport system substrate-binding protein
MSRIKSCMYVVASLALALPIAACGGSAPSASETPSNTGGSVSPITPAWQAIIDAAKQEGSVTLYSALEADRAVDLTRAFEKKYPGIKLEASRMLTADANNKLEIERTSGAPGADIFVANDQGFLSKQYAADPARLAKLAGPNFATLDPSLILKDGHAALVRFGAIALGWNTTQVSTPLTSVRDLLKPEFRGKVGLPTPRAANLYFWNALEKNGGPGFLQELAASKPKFLVGTGDIGPAVASGEIAVSPYSLYPLFQNLKSKGAPVEANLKLTGTERSPASPYIVELPGWAKHPKAAQLLANFLVSPEGQAIICKDDVSVVSGVAAAAVSTNDVDPTTGVLPPNYNDRVAEINKIFGR